jgi:hypothetical protein
MNETNAKKSKNWRISFVTKKIKRTTMIPQKFI